MNARRQVTAIALALSVYHLSMIAAIAAPASTGSLKQQVEDLGVGARVQVKLARDQTLRGTIESIDTDDFQLAQRGGTSTRIAYVGMAQVKLAQRAYRIHGAPNPVEARQVVLSLGVGKHVVVKFSGRELHGHIQAIDANAFTLLPDRETTPVPIAYSDIRYVEKNLSLGGTIVLLVLIGAAVIVTAAVLANK